MHPIGTNAINSARMIHRAASVIVMSSPNDVEIPTFHLTINLLRQL
jgi:hypothetical protein